MGQTRTFSLGAARSASASADMVREGSSVGQLRNSASKVQSVDQRMRLGMRCRLSPTADVRVAHVRGSYVSIDVGILLSIPIECWRMAC